MQKYRHLDLKKVKLCMFGFRFLISRRNNG